MELRFDVTPLDLAILGALPDEGAMQAWDYEGRTVAELSAHLSGQAGQEVTPARIQARLRTMKAEGQELVIDQPGGANNKRKWQRTVRGQELIAERGVPDPNA